MKTFIAAAAVLIIVLNIVLIAAVPGSAQGQSGNPKPGETESDITYHFTMVLPQYRFLDTSGNASRVGEYDSLQQSLGGDLSLNFVDVPQKLSIKSTLSVISRDDYDSKARLTLGKWFDFDMENRGFVRHLDDNFFFGASVISPDIVRIDTIPPDSLLGVRRRMNNFRAKVPLPNIPVKLFVKGGWQARDGNSQMQFFDMGGSGDHATDLAQGCANCHSASKYRTLDYTTRNIAGGAEVTLGRLMKLTYQHEYRSFNDRLQNPSDLYGTSGEIPAVENIPYEPAGYYVHSVLPRNDTQADSLQISLKVAHQVTFNGDVSYARTTNLFANHPQNAFDADATLVWNPISKLRVVADFHQQNLLNDFVQTFALSDPTILYPFGNPSLHRHWAGVRLAYRLTNQFDVEAYYKRLNVTRSDSNLWPQISSPDNTDPLFVVPSTFSNIAGMTAHFHSGEMWDARAGYEWTGTHDPGYVTDPKTNHRVWADATITPVRWFSWSNDASIMLQQSFPVIQRNNHVYTYTSFVTFRPVPQWSVGGGYTYLQDSLRTDMQFANDGAVGVYAQSLVPYKEVDQTYSIRSTYEVKRRVGLSLNFLHSVAHSGFRPDLNPGDYPIFPGAVSVAGYASDAAFATAFSQALALGSGLVSKVDVPQTLIGSNFNYHFGMGFDGGLRFNYGSYTDYVRPDLNGKLRSYSVFMGRVW